MADLEVRVETLEGTAADHETRISATESDITGRSRMSVLFVTDAVLNLTFKLESPCSLLLFYNSDLEETVTQQETRLTAAEENIQGNIKTVVNIKFLLFHHLFEILKMCP